jgi:hypothetical protein
MLAPWAPPGRPGPCRLHTPRVIAAAPGRPHHCRAAMCQWNITLVLVVKAHVFQLLRLSGHCGTRSVHMASTQPGRASGRVPRQYIHVVRFNAKFVPI